MVRLVRALALLLCCAPAILRAQGSSDDLRSLREAIDQQSRQIDVLAQEIARLNLLLQSRAPGAANLPPIPVDTAASTTGEAPKAMAVDAGEAATAPRETPSGPVHIVTKGETLTAIARHYKVTVPDLMKVNKIADVRRLQIGQAVALPPDAKIPASPTPSPQSQ
jgi:hypothetical protein